MNRPLLPLRAYVAATSESEWRPLKSFTLYKSPQCRMRVAVEQHVNPAEGLDRDETLAERDNISALVEDSKEFAQDITAQLGEHLSFVELEYMVAALQADLEERRKAFADKR
jgi:hypothetical protein